MTIRQFYQEINGDYEEVYRRIPDEALIKKFLLKFPEDKSMNQLAEALQNENISEAFRAVHTLKGLCLNLGFSAMAHPASELTELLRKGQEEGSEELYKCLLSEYKKTTKLLKEIN